MGNKNSCRPNARKAADGAPPTPRSSHGAPTVISSNNKGISQTANVRAFGMADLPALADALKGSGASRVNALEALLKLASDEANRAVLGSARSGFLLLLRDVIRQSGPDKLTALTVLTLLSIADENEKYMASGDLGLLHALRDCVQDNAGEESVAALFVLQNLSCATDNMLPMASPEVGLLPMLKMVVEDRYGEERIRAMDVLQNLAYATDNKAPMVSSSIGLLPALTKVLSEGNGESMVAALNVLQNLSISNRAKLPMATAELGLLPVLVKITEDCNGEERIQALSVLYNLAIASANHVAMAFPALRLHSALLTVLREGGRESTMVLALNVLQNVSMVCGNKPHMASIELEMVSVLRAVLVRDSGEARARSLLFIHKLFTEGNVPYDALTTFGSILELVVQDNIWKVGLDVALQEKVMAAALHLQQHLAKVGDLAAKVLVEHGVPLDLFFACVRYHVLALDDQIEHCYGKGIAAAMATYGQLMDQKARIECDLVELMELRIGLPPGFQALDNNIKRQAIWLRQQLDTYSTTLMKNKDRQLLGAFQKYFTSLPDQLQVVGDIAAENIVASDSIAHALIMDGVTLDTADNSGIIVDGSFCDGPTFTPVKIKLRSIEHSAMIHHEYNMLCKFHKHVPSAVVAPFALVSTANRTLRKHPIAENIHGDLSKFLGIVLEKGTRSMDRFLTTSKAKEPLHRTSMLVDAVNIVVAAHGCQIVLMDFKPANMVYCNPDHDVASWKAIDFDNSRHFGVEVAQAATPEYTSYEMARHMLNGGCAASLKADPAMDICSLGWTVWVIFNNGVSLWDMLGLTTKTSTNAARREQDRRIFAKLASMAQSELLQHINTAFADDTSVHSALRRFLPKLLHVDPRLRLQANQLRTATSLLGATNPTILSTVHGIHNKLDEMSAQFRLALDGQLQETALMSIKDNHAADTTTVLAAIVGILQQQREDAKHDRLSMARIKSAIDGLPTAMASSMLPSINAILADQHDQTMTALDKLDDVTAMMADMKLQLDEVLNLQRTQLSILNHLQQQGFKFPHTFIILPQRPTGPRKPKTVLGRMGSVAKSVYDAVTDQLFTTMYLFFFCPVTCKLVPCGPGSQGYVLSALKAWVKQLVPIIRMGLLVAKVVLATQGFGGIIPNFPNKEDQEHLSDMLADLTSNVELAAAHLQNQAPMKSLEADVIDALDSDFMNSIVSAVAKQDGVTGTLADIQGYIPQHVGLNSVTYLKTGNPSMVAWVSKDGEAAFQRDGPKAFRKIN